MNIKQVENITNYLYEFARVSPGKPILLHPVVVTYSDFCKLVDSYAFGFLKNDISKGTKTIVLIKSGIDLFATIFALLRIGAVPVLADPGMGNKAMAKALSNVNAEACVGIPKALLLKYVFPTEFKTVKTWISTGFCGFAKGAKLSSFRKKRNANYEVAKMNKEDAVAVFYTSGSTGPAKAVLYKNYMFDAQLNYLRNHFHYHPQEIDLCTFPLIGLFSMCLGLSVVFADMDMTRPATLNPKKIIQNINKFECTYMFCSPMVLKKLAEFGVQKHLKLLSLKKIMIAGAPVSVELLQKFETLISDDTKIHTPYGATEALPISDIHHKELLALYENAGSNLNGVCVGYPLKNIDLKIIKITDLAITNWETIEECNKGDVGEIVIRGENVSQNYVNNKLANKLSKIEDTNHSLLWHRTGDLGRMDKMGRVWFFGRKSQRVEAGDRTLFTIPTEAVFNKHDGVERSALLGVVDNQKTKPVVCIQLKQGKRESKNLVDELKRLAKTSSFTACISDFYFYEKFPVDPRHNAKIYREKLAKWIQKKIK